MTTNTLRRRWIWLVFPFLALPLALRVVLPRIGDALARATLSLAPSGSSSKGAVPPSEPPAPENEAVAGADDAVPEPSALPPPAAPRRVKSGRDAGSILRDAGARATLFISAAVTTRALPLAAKGMRAVGVVLPDGTRGIELHGVRPLRAGLEEGDVVISLEGRPTPTQEDALAAITSALAAHALTVHATLLRRGRPVDVTVEIPAS